MIYCNETIADLPGRQHDKWRFILFFPGFYIMPSGFETPVNRARPCRLNVNMQPDQKTSRPSNLATRLTLPVTALLSAFTLQQMVSLAPVLNKKGELVVGIHADMDFRKMFRFFVFCVCAFKLETLHELPKFSELNFPSQPNQNPISVALASAGKTSRHHKNSLAPDSSAQSSHSVLSISGYGAGSIGGEFGKHDSSHDGKYSNGAELTSIAHSSAVQANNAVQNQQTAGSQAEFGIKSSLASAALGAAQTAQAALIGKQALVQNLRQQLGDAQLQLQSEIALYQKTEAAAQAALEATQQAQTQLRTLTAAVASAQGGSDQAELVAGEAANVAASQQSMVAEAEQRVAKIHAKLEEAAQDLQETESSAQKAKDSALIAQSNAATAGAAISAKGSRGGHSGGFHHY
ncbi:hypothetical protein NQ318_010230 [Aromia moschata]|uniref:Uncharacterized protein n=1 Tax=Aromia moschata TaxID=1265417 RepID=A0AAV8YIV2_9CUCU|nr:hypothetical protein NQ318_010230 [Aromia moschata]